MQAHKDKIKAEGKSPGKGILKVDGFVNHRIDATLMRNCGEAFAELFRHTRSNHVLTAEISGIAPALMTAAALGCAMVYARKKRPVTMPEDAYMALAPSHLPLIREGVSLLLWSHLNFLKRVNEC